MDRGFEVPPCSRLDLLRCADEVHSAVEYDGATPFPIVHFLENVIPQIYPDAEVEIVPAGYLGDKFGEAFPADHLIRLPEDVYDAAVAGNGFSRMTVAHEIAHLLWHEKVPVSLARRAGKNLPAYRTSEWQANALAGALLMPIRKIVAMDPQEVSEKYLVSLSAARTQTRAAIKNYERFSATKGAPMK
ncbi:ImmA/IrrE family metallo-endopeptidase [Thermophilibacter mediterraneus]|uniref:ImmA/IrrE family metallo-endopeptidase n=1 Tax=Thermophilibacter mediterraneus TaxID=1871031 RepID=UPI00320AA53D